jgi:Tfp pilus assembly protein PilZ
MWQAPNQRLRAIAAQRERDRRRGRRPFHIKRVQAEVKAVGGLHVAQTVAAARVLLNDLSPKGIGLFSSAPMMVGQEVALTLEEPKRFYVRGKIVWCQELDGGTHVLSEKKFTYRIGIEFVFQSATEEQSVRAYCEELSAQHLNGSQAA